MMDELEKQKVQPQQYQSAAATILAVASELHSTVSSIRKKRRKDDYESSTSTDNAFVAALLEPATTAVTKNNEVLVVSDTTPISPPDRQSDSESKQNSSKRRRTCTCTCVGSNYISVANYDTIDATSNKKENPSVLVGAPSTKDYFATGGIMKFVPRPEWFRTTFTIISSWKSSNPTMGLTREADTPVDCITVNHTKNPEDSDENDMEDCTAKEKCTISNYVIYDKDQNMWKQRRNKCLEHPFMMENPSLWLLSSKIKRFGKDRDTILHLAIRENAIDAAHAIIRIEYNTLFDLYTGLKPYDAKAYLKISLLEITNDKGVTPLILAAQKGYVSIVQTLLQCGVNFVTKTQSGSSAILQAAHFGHTHVIESIISYHSTISHLSTIVSLYDLVNMPNSNQTTPLMRAAQEGHLSTVQQLLKYGGNVHHRNSGTMTTLMLAAQRGHAKICKLLIKNGANVNATTHQKSTPLSLACSRGHIDVVRVLVAAGCELNITDDRNRTVQQVLEQRIRRHENNNNNDADSDDAARNPENEAVSSFTNCTMLQLLNPRTQIDLMQNAVRVERNYEIIIMHTLLQRNRANIEVPELMCDTTTVNTGCCDVHTVVEWINDVSIKNINLQSTRMLTKSSLNLLHKKILPSKLPHWLTDLSTQALIRAMTLPPPLLQTIALFLPLPPLWKERMLRMQSISSLENPNAVVIDALDMIDEILEEGGFLSACDLAQVPAPIPFMSWYDWKRSFQSRSTNHGDNGKNTNNGNTTITQSRVKVTESGPPIPKDEQNPQAYELRRQVGYLPLLDKYQSQTDIVSILHDAPYSMPMNVIQQLIRIADIASICRRCCVGPLHRTSGTGSVHVINFESNAAMDIIMLVSRLSSWYWRERHISRVENRWNLGFDTRILSNEDIMKLY